MYLEKTIEERIDLFEEHLLETNRGFNFYVDWRNVTGLDKFTIELHALDALIGQKDDFDTVFVSLLKKIPSVVTVFPLLFALSKSERETVTSKKGVLKVVGTELDSADMQYFNFCAKNELEEEQIKSYLNFFVQMGLKNLFQNLIEKSTNDYVTGALIGLDSNGRKNRGGKAFELACEPIIKTICAEKNIEVITQKQFKVLQKKGFVISEDIAERKADFILLKGSKCFNIEVNFYSGGGSKPEEIVDSYINRQADLNQNKIGFILITDGKCWKGTTHQLKKGFRHLNYLLNYKMTKTGMLEEIIEKNFRD